MLTLWFIFWNKTVTPSMLSTQLNHTGVALQHKCQSPWVAQQKQRLDFIEKSVEWLDESCCETCHASHPAWPDLHIQANTDVSKSFKGLICNILHINISKIMSYVNISSKNNFIKREWSQTPSEFVDLSLLFTLPHYTFLFVRFLLAFPRWRALWLSVWQWNSTQSCLYFSWMCK